MISAKDIVDQVGALPALPDTAVKLMNVINDPRSTVDEIVGAVKYDQAVTSDVLRLCNSAYFGLSRTITSLNEAMLCLGTVKVLQLVMSVHTNSMLSSAQRGYGLEPGVLWKHSVAVALASSAVAQRIELSNVSMAFTGGLLHDIGKVVLNEHVSDEFARIVKRVTEDGRSFTEAENEILGFSHVEVGAMIGEKWNLPGVLVRCIRYHHAPEELDPPEPLVDAVYLANCICLLLGIGLGEDGLSHRAEAAVVERHHLHESDLEMIGAQVVLDLERVEQLFAETGESKASSNEPLTKKTAVPVKGR